MYSVNIIHIVFLECMLNFSLMVAPEERSGVIRATSSIAIGSKFGKIYSNKFIVRQFVFIY